MPFLEIPSKQVPSKARTFLVLKNESVAGQALLEVDDGLVGLLHGAYFDPWLDPLGGRQFQHLLDLLGGTDEGTTDLDAVGDESEGVDWGKVATVGSTNLDEGTANLQEGQVLSHGHLLAGDGADDQVEGTGVLGGPVLVLTSGDVLVGTELEDVVTLVVLAGDTNNAVSTESLGEEDTEVTKTTNTDDTDSLAGTTAVADEGRVDGNTTAEHGSGLSTIKTIGDLECESTRVTGVGCVATVGLAGAVLVLVAVCVGSVQAMALVAVLAVLALAAAVGLSADTDWETISTLVKLR